MSFYQRGKSTLIILDSRALLAQKECSEDYSWNLTNIGEFVECLPVPLLFASLFSPKKDSRALDSKSKSILPDSNNNP